MNISGNKGEWSELYVLIRLLADGKIYSANEDLSKKENCYLPILKIFRVEDRVNKIEYKCSNKKSVELYFNGRLVRSIETSELTKAAEFFYSEIVQNQGKKAFEIDGAEDFMEKLKCKKIKADSNDKTDITMEVHDPFTNYNRICGYSIKSDLGASPTLFNASKATNFKFEIFDMTDTEATEINNINTNEKIKDRVSRLKNFIFVSVLNENFARNLLFVDTQMEKFLAEMLKIYYSENVSRCAELATLLDERDPLNLKVENIYPHKIKKFLCAVALGLRPTKIWNGLDEANGGYIIVKESGEVLAYHLHDRNSFENYLLNNTRLETPSTGKHNFGSIYTEGGRKFINLNLQIRFF